MWSFNKFSFKKIMYIKGGRQASLLTCSPRTINKLEKSQHYTSPLVSNSFSKTHTKISIDSYHLCFKRGFLKVCFSLFRYYLPFRNDMDRLLNPLYPRIKFVNF